MKADRAEYVRVLLPALAAMFLAAASLPAWAQVAPIPPTTCGNLATAEFSGTFGSLSGASTWRDLQIPPGSGYRYGPAEKPSFPLAAPNAEGRYAVASYQSSANLHDSAVHWQNLYGHNQGGAASTTDAYLAVNGSTSQGTFYRQEVVLVPNQTYRLSMFAVNAINLVGYNGAWPNLEIRIVNVLTGAVVASDNTGPLPDKEGAFVGPSDWTQANVDFSSGVSTRFRIEVRNLSVQSADNDFAIDDVTVAPLTEAGCPIDFGDAPDASNGTAQGNYQTRLADNGARHTLVGGLFIGTTATAETDALQNATATGDADDGSASTLNLYAGQTVTVPVSVTNTTGSDAFLAGFLDFNRDGDFLDAGEVLTPVTVPTNTGALQTLNMTFTVPTTAVPGTSFIRFRLATVASQITAATGAATRGEVEDYQVTLQSTVTLTKAWVGAISGDAVSLSITGGTSPSTGSSVAGGATTPARSLANGGNTITLTEAFNTGSASNYLTTLACTKNTDGSAVTVNGAGLGRTITMPSDSPVTCTYTNERAATLRIQKTRVGNSGSPQVFNFVGAGPGTGLPGDDTFSFDLPNSMSLTHDYGTTNANTATPGTTALNNLPAGTYTITESFTENGVANDFEVTNISCVNQAGGVIGSTVTPTLGSNGGSATINLVGGANYLCTFINTRDPKIILTKQVQGAGASFGFNVTATGTGTITPSAPTLAPPTNGTAQATIDVSLATATSRDVTLTEAAPPAGYVLVSATCTKTRTASNGTTTTTNYTGSTATRAVTLLDMTASDTAACTFVNAQQSTVVFRKQTVGGTGTFGFAGGSNLASSSFTLNTATGGNPASTAAINFTTPGQPASLTETVPTGWVLTSATCVDASNIQVGGTTLSGGTLTIPGGATTGGQQLTCTFVNTRQPILRLQKQLPNGRFAATDQFALTIAGAGGPATATTTGSGTTATGTATLNIATAGTAYTFSEAGASGADLSNYTSRYSCTNAFGSGTAVAPGAGNSFSVTPQAGDDITCTFVNTRDPLVDLAIAKTNTIASGPLDQAGDTVTSGTTVTYTLTVSNNGPDAAVGALVRDVAQSGLTCPGTGNPDTVTCSGPACTGATPLTVTGLLSGGITLGTLPSGQTTTLTFACRVN